MRLHHPDGQVFTFDAGALCLELACTTGGEGFRARFEVLHDPAALAGWVERSRLGVPAAEVAATDAELAGIKRLREAVWAGASGLATGGGVTPGDAAVINEIAAGAPPVPQIGPEGARAWRRPVTGGQIAAAIARDAVATLTAPAAARVRMCGADTCALIYLDTSRPGNRRWCSMERCGNRAKVRDHRRRQAES
jgi:predicted RNA-binding Zn ribbon-like protein